VNATQRDPLKAMSKLDQSGNWTPSSGKDATLYGDQRAAISICRPKNARPRRGHLLDHAHHEGIGSRIRLRSQCNCVDKLIRLNCKMIHAKRPGRHQYGRAASPVPAPGGSFPGAARSGRGSSKRETAARGAVSKRRTAVLRSILCTGLFFVFY